MVEKKNDTTVEPKLSAKEQEEADEAKKLGANPGGIETAKDEVANRQLREDAAEEGEKAKARAAKAVDDQPKKVTLGLAPAHRNAIFWERIDEDTEVTITKGNDQEVPYITGRMSKAIAEGVLVVR